MVFVLNFMVQFKRTLKDRAYILYDQFLIFSESNR